MANLMAVRSSLGRFVGTSGLSKLQGDVVRSLIENGGNRTATATALGVSVAKVHGVLKSPAVQQAIRRERENVLNEKLSVIALGTLEDVMKDKDCPAHARVQAARICLELAGHAPAKAQVQTDRQDKPMHEMTLAELAELMRLGQQTLDQLEQEGVTIDVPAQDSAQVAAESVENKGDSEKVTA